MCVEMQLSHHESCWCCCLCRGSATRRLECWWIEHRVYRERRQLQHEHRSSHESGSVVSTADAATPNEGRIPTSQQESSRVLWCLVPIEYPQLLKLDTGQTWCVPTKKAAHLQTMINTLSVLMAFSRENTNNKFGTSLCQPWIVYKQVFHANHATTVLTVDRRYKTVCALASSLSISCMKM